MTTPTTTPQPLDPQTRRELWIEVAAVLAIVLPLPLFHALSAYIRPDDGAEPSLDLTRVSVELFFSTTAWAVLALFVIHRSGESWKTFGLQRPLQWTDGFVALALAMVLAGLERALGAGMLLLVGPEMFEQPWFSRRDEFAPVESSLTVALTVLASLAIGLGEELIWRAYLITRLKVLLGSSVQAVLVSAALFATYHVYQGVYGLVVIFGWGIFYGISFLLLRRIWPLVLVHFVIDANRLNIYAGFVATALLLGLLPLVVGLHAIVRRSRR